MQKDPLIANNLQKLFLFFYIRKTRKVIRRFDKKKTIMKNKLQLEYSLNVSPNILFTRLSTPDGLSEWFADDINVQNNIFKFYWNDAEQDARLLHKKNNKYIRFKWFEDEEDESFFEFRINQDELTGDVALIITDFAEPDERDDVAELWDTQIEDLKHILGVT